MPFYSAASLQYHAPDTQRDTTTSHIILTPVRPVLALLPNAERRAKEQLVPFLESLWYDPARDRTHDLPVSKLTLYLLSY